MPGPFPAGRHPHARRNCASRCTRPAPPARRSRSKFAGTDSRRPRAAVRRLRLQPSRRASTRRSSARPTPPRRARRTTARSRTATVSRSARSRSSRDTTILANTNPLVTITTPGRRREVPPRRAGASPTTRAPRPCTRSSSCVATDARRHAARLLHVRSEDLHRHRDRRERRRHRPRPSPTTSAATSTPVVDAGTDQTVNGGALVTLHGSADRPRHRSDPLVPVVADRRPGRRAEPRRRQRPVRAEPAVRRAPRRPVDLTFRLRVDDGFDTGEDTVVVHVTANNGPVITNGAAQTINNVKTHGTVTMNGARDRSRGRHPDHVHWTQVDDHGVPARQRRPAARHARARRPPRARRSRRPKGPATLHFQVVATDSLGATATGTVTVNVLANNPPVDHRRREPDAQQHQDQRVGAAQRHRDRPRQRGAERQPGAQLLVDAGRRATATRSTPIDPTA